MTYFGFLALFLLVPLAILTTLNRLDARRGRYPPGRLQAWPLWGALAAHVVVALIYTTPWDNYLVATGVWHYDHDLVTGITLGWVPLEEYVFFVLQPLTVGMWLSFLTRRRGFGSREHSPDSRLLRRATTAAAALVLLGALAALLARLEPLTYLALELIWAIPAIAGQLAFGADILWHERWLAALAIVPATLCLSVADAIAISNGIWEIDRAQSLQVFLGGVLPFEEFVFFLLTNTVLVFGMILVLSRKSQLRAPQSLGRRHRPSE